MKLAKLLSQRSTLLQQARLANLGFSYATLAEFSRRIAQGNLRGSVTLRHPLPEAERYCATLVAHEGNPSVLEEHFTDEDILDLADVLAFLTGETRVDLTFRLEEVSGKFVRPLRQELEQIGVEVEVDDVEPDAATASDATGSNCPQTDEAG